MYFTEQTLRTCEKGVELFAVDTRIVLLEVTPEDYKNAINVFDHLNNL